MGFVAQQYAEALFGVAIDSNELETVLKEYKVFNQAIDESISLFLKHPKISKKEKKEVIEKAVKNKSLRSFIFVLIDNSRVEYLAECLVELEKIIDNQNRVMKVEVFSGNKLNKLQLEQLESNLKNKHNREIKLTNIVDKSIVGGLRIEYDGHVLDETINNYLYGLKANLTK